MTPYLEILQPDGSAERYPLGGGEHVVVGRQPREGIALPYAGELELEHVRLTPRREGCWFSITQGARTPATVAGQYFAGGLVPWGGAVELGSLRLRVTDTIPDAARVRSSRTTVFASLALLAAAGWLFMPAEEGAPGMTTAAPPALFAAASPKCPEEDPAAAGPRAKEAADAARAKSERYPFAAQDGIRAAELYALAAACFTTAGREGDADRMTRDRQALVAHIEEDYRTHRLKLERAIEYRRTTQALLESRALLALVGHLDHAYTTWLHSVERRLSLKTGGAKP